MEAAGMPPFPPGHPKTDTSRIVRYGPGKKAWYRLYEHVAKNGRSYITGAFGVWGQLDATKIQTDWTGIDEIERHRIERTRREAEACEEARRQERAHNASNRARQQWKSASTDGPWPYLDRKLITPEHVRAFSDGTLLVPAFVYTDTGAEMVGVQKIAPNGTKRFNKNMAKAGASCRLGQIDTSHAFPIAVIAEGYATSRSIRMALAEQAPVYVAFDAGNLLAVAQAVRDRFPSVHLLFAADDDWRTDGNPGMAKAIAAADALGSQSGMASVVRPLFPDGRAEGCTDFNDLHAVAGLQAVKDQLVAAIVAARLRGNMDDAVAPHESPGPASPPIPAGATEEDAKSEPPPARARGARRAEPEDDADAGENREHVWRASLSRTDKGAIKSTMGNIALILEHDEGWKGVLATDTFSGAVLKLRAPPYEFATLGEWCDMDDTRLRLWIERRYGFSPKADDVVHAVMEQADRRAFHPVREYLRDLKWDGTDRLEYWLSDFLGAPNTEYTRLVGRLWMIQAVARVMQPGCKADSVLILEGRQGLMKSSALKALAHDWFTDTPLHIGDKEAYLLISGVWIVELAELDSFSRADSSAAKAFFTQTESHYRPWYAKRPVKVPRQCVFAGTVNDDVYLKDDTGNRRYWPVHVGQKVEIDALIAVRDQLWAEAMHRYTAGESWWAQDEQKPLFEEEQEQRRAKDAYVERIEAWLSQPERKLQREFSMSDVLGSALQLDTRAWTRAEQIRVGRCLRELGMLRRRSSEAGRPWVYVRSSASDDRQEEPTKRVYDDEDLPI